MHPHEVRYFLTMCKELNFTRAAKRCGVSQPSLSNSIKRLEQKLGGPLFLRHGNRGVRLTELGRQLRPYLARIEQCDQEAKQMAKGFVSHRPERVFHNKATEAPMRSHHIIAIVAVLIVGFGIKMFYFSSPVAEAQLIAPTVDVLQMQGVHPNMKGLQEEDVQQPVEYDVKHPN
jgi:hypothetical protein